MDAPDDSFAMLRELTRCAFRMGKALAAEADQIEDIRLKLDVVQAFDRCFFSMRMGLALEARLERQISAKRTPEAERVTDTRPAAERARPAARRTGTSLPRERDRESERVSLSALIRTLRRVADDAAALAPAGSEDLARLRSLLAQAPAPPPTQRRPRKPGPTRPRRAGLSAAKAAQDRQPQRTPPPRRRATGPPTG